MLSPYAGGKMEYISSLDVSVSAAKSKLTTCEAAMRPEAMAAHVCKKECRPFERTLFTKSSMP